MVEVRGDATEAGAPDATATAPSASAGVVGPLESLEGLDDDALTAIVRRAAVLPLLAALAQETGDLSLLRDDLRPDPTRMREPTGGITDEQRREAQRVALDALRALRDHAAPRRPLTDEASFREIVEFVTGTSVPDDYRTLLREELAAEGVDHRAPAWTQQSIAPDRDLQVVIIGAGMSGIAAAHRLDQAGISCTILEKNDEVGGTWLQNRYPGCRVDVPSHLYSYSFAQRDWPEHFSAQPVLLDYFRKCADELGVREHIRFGTEVVSAAFDDERVCWRVTTRTAGGTQETLDADVLISAVGQLNRPSFPDIAGRERFTGPSFHSAEWDHGVDLTGKRVAVIGTGASAIQLVPEVAAQADRLFLYQRTPNWFVPAAEYHQPVPDETQELFQRLPSAREWYRLWLFWRLAEGLLPAAAVDPGWDGDTASYGAANDEIRMLLTMFIQMHFNDAPELLPHVVPAYPPLAKRMLLDDGTWASALKRDNVELVTAPITEITETGVATADGAPRDVDVIVYATGFEASRFLVPMQVTGRGGVDLHEHWDGDARAYLGVTVPGFPNLFCLYGPNTNLVANGSIIFFSECEVTYLLDAMRLLLERDVAAINCRADVCTAYNEEIDAANARMVWGASPVNSWYKNRAGRVTQNWPGTLLEFWQRTRHVDPDDYELLPRP